MPRAGACWSWRLARCPGRGIWLACRIVSVYMRGENMNTFPCTPPPSHGQHPSCFPAPLLVKVKGPLCSSRARGWAGAWEGLMEWPVLPGRKGVCVCFPCLGGTAQPTGWPPYTPPFVIPRICVCPILVRRGHWRRSLGGICFAHTSSEPPNSMWAQEKGLGSQFPGARKVLCG